MKPFDDARVLDTYLGIEPFTVVIDPSDELSGLVAQAQEYRGLGFDEKLKKVRELASGAMINAYEQFRLTEDMLETGEFPEGMDRAEVEVRHKKYQGIVSEKHPLSHALSEQAGCCRYQGALFFALSFEAELGIGQRIQVAPVGDVFSVFNDVFAPDGRIHHVSIYRETLTDSRFDYTKNDPDLYDHPKDPFNGLRMFSYQKTPEGFVVVGKMDSHP